MLLRHVDDSIYNPAFGPKITLDFTSSSLDHNFTFLMSTFFVVVLSGQFVVLEKMQMTNISQIPNDFINNKVYKIVLFRWNGRNDLAKKLC